MPIETGYQAQLGPREGQAMPGGNAQGAMAIGQALDQAGAMVHEQQVRAYTIEQKRQSDEELADFNHRMALHQQNVEAMAIEARNNSEPGGKGHVERMAAANDAGRDALFAGVKNPQVQRYAAARWDEYRSGLVNRETGWAEGQRMVKTLTDYAKAGKVNEAIVLRDRSQLKSVLSNELTSIELMHVSPDVKEKLASERIGSLYSAAAEGHLQNDPDGFQKAAQAGEYDVLGGDELARLNRQADSVKHSHKLAERAEKAANEADYNERVRFATKAVEDGQPIDDKVLDVLEQEGAALGVAPDKMYDLRQSRVTNQVAREYRSATPVLIADDLAKLDARIAKAGTKASADDVLRSNAMHKVLTKRREQVNSDPLGVAAQAGIDVPPVNWAMPDAAAVAGRVKAGRAAAALTGGEPQFIRPDEMAWFEAEYGKGTAGQLEVLKRLDLIDDPFDKAAAARQIAPRDRNFQHLAQLNRANRAMVMQGQQALKANGKMMTPGKDDPLGAAAHVSKVNTDIDVALKLAGAEDRQAIKDNARQWYAGFLASKGYQSVDDHFDKRSYDVAVRVAAGGTVSPRGSTGGLSYWNDHPIWVADGFSFEGLQMAFRRDHQRQLEAGGGPVQLDGKTPFDLSKAWPVMVAPGIYRWETKGGVVLDKRGGAFYSKVSAGQ
ncbi:MAG: hypothetical protein K2W91_04665 [Novosphingobium sp.]|nr:hypothetical protein [Novosphingobium sp.]